MLDTDTKIFIRGRVTMEEDKDANYLPRDHPFDAVQGIVD